LFAPASSDNASLTVRVSDMNPQPGLECYFLIVIRMFPFEIL